MIDVAGAATGPEAQAMGGRCWAHTHREWVPENEHHVWPTGHGGPNIAGNRVWLCANAHGAVHLLMDKMLAAGTEKLPWLLLRRFGPKVRRLAVAGYRAVTTRRVVQP
jgi:hypothetical protein